MSQTYHTPDAMRDLIEGFETDREALRRALTPVFSPACRARMRRFYAEWTAALEERDFSALSHDAQIDWLLFRNCLDYERRQLDIQERALKETDSLLPIAPTILNLEEARRRGEPVEAARAAAQLHDLSGQIAALRQSVEGDSAVGTEIGRRAAETVDGLRSLLELWFTYYDGYDPTITWWIREPYRTAERALRDYAAFLRERIVGIPPGDEEVIVGSPIGREALVSELAHELIPYTPEALLAIADREFSWCEAQMQKAAQELGYGDDWRGALEQVKTQHVAPGQQPALVRELALEAIAFLDAHDLVTIPPLARETWRMEMMSPEQQRVNPFFLGGEIIRVSFPTDGMAHERKMMSLRGNNAHFARATVFHELIPGHHLQGFMALRHRAYRRLFHTPFYVEGWALHWEMLLWDLHFARSPEDRIGMLFWRTHRCARIVFSLRFHLGEMTPQECVAFLVERVGHERENATAEVRRSCGDAYPPLYQCAYLLGGLQMRALYRELVEAGTMDARAFHDAVLMENAIPIEMVRARLIGLPLSRQHTAHWTFYGP